MGVALGNLRGCISFKASCLAGIFCLELLLAHVIVAMVVPHARSGKLNNEKINEDKDEQ